MPRRSEPRDSQLSWDEIFKVYTACHDWHHLRIFMLLDITTAQRKTAILELEWTRVDFERRQIDFRRNRDEEDILNTGGRKGRSIVDMGDLVYRQLWQARQLAETPYVIEWRGKPVKDIKKALKAAFKRAGITKPFAGAHAIRKSVGGLLADAGEEMRRIQKLLGHHDFSTTDRSYSAHSRGYLVQAVNLLEAIITAKNTVIEPEEVDEDGGSEGEKGVKRGGARFNEPISLDGDILEGDLSA